MIQSNLAFKLVNRIIKIKESKNFFAIERNSFYSEPLLFYVKDIFIPLSEYPTTKLPDILGVYSFTTNVQVLHTPKKKVILNANSFTYQIYGIRSEPVFYLAEICKKNHQTIEKEFYYSDKLTTQPAFKLLTEIDDLLNH